MKKIIALLGVILLGLLLAGCTQNPPVVKNQTNTTGNATNATIVIPLENMTNASETELCVIEDGQIYYNGSLVKDRCASETSVLSPSCDTGTLGWESQMCGTDQICMLGECIATPINTLCVDNDKGRNLTVAGSVTFQGQTFVDKCEGSNIKEYYCQNDGVQVTMVACPNYFRCENGACVPIQPTCTNKGWYVQLDLPTGYSEKYYNYCSDNQKFSVKYGCTSGNYTQLIVDCMPDEYCPRGNDTCRQRVCEGMNKINMSYPIQHKPAFVTYGPDIYYNKCEDNRTLKAYYCDVDNNVNYDKIKCSCTTDQRDFYNPYNDKTVTVSAGYCG